MIADSILDKLFDDVREQVLDDLIFPAPRKIQLRFKGSVCEEKSFSSIEKYCRWLAKEKFATAGDLRPQICEVLAEGIYNAFGHRVSLPSVCEASLFNDVFNCLVVLDFNFTDNSKSCYTVSMHDFAVMLLTSAHAEFIFPE